MKTEEKERKDGCENSRGLYDWLAYIMAPCISPGQSLPEEEPETGQGFSLGTKRLLQLLRWVVQRAYSWVQCN